MPHAGIRRLALLASASLLMGAMGLVLFSPEPAYALDAEGESQQSLVSLLERLENADANSQKATLDLIDSYGRAECRTEAEKLVPVLSKCLESRDAAVRQKALAMLEELGADGAASIPALDKVLAGIHDDDRYEAVDVLKSMGPAAAPAVPTLIETLDDKDQSTRDRAVEALGAIGPAAKDAIPALVGILKAGWTTSNAERTLAAIGPDAIPALLDGLQNKLPSCRQLCIKGLGLMRATDRPEIVISAITERLRDKNFDVAREACWTLTAIGAPAKSAVPALIEQLKNKDQYMRQFAADALGAIGPGAKDALPVLKKSLTDERVRRNAASAIKKIELGEQE